MGVSIILFHFLLVCRKKDQVDKDKIKNIDKAKFLYENNLK